MGRDCQTDLQLPGGGEPPPYGCVTGGRVPLDGAARQICSCPAGASPRPTGA